jgi:hypothetical protein
MKRNTIKRSSVLLGLATVLSGINVYAGPGAAAGAPAPAPSPVQPAQPVQQSPPVGNNGRIVRRGGYTGPAPTNIIVNTPNGTTAAETPTAPGTGTPAAAGTGTPAAAGTGTPSASGTVSPIAPVPGTAQSPSGIPGGPPNPRGPIVTSPSVRTAGLQGTTPATAMPRTNTIISGPVRNRPPGATNLPGTGNFGVFPGTGTNGVPPGTPLQTNNAVGGTGNQPAGTGNGSGSSNPNRRQ